MTIGTTNYIDNTIRMCKILYLNFGMGSNVKITTLIRYKIKLYGRVEFANREKPVRSRLNGCRPL